MADQDVIKEFLVGLGFKVDQKGAKDFTWGIENATKSVAKLVATIAGASLTVAAGVAAFASNLEGLYFAAQRTGASAESLKSAEYAARGLGASAEEARGSIEGLAKFLRDTPGGEDFLKGIGVQTRDANGNLKDTADMLVNIGQKLKAMPWYQANQYAGVLGIDEKTLRAIQDDKFGAQLEKNRKKLNDSGLDQATKDAHAFMDTLRDVGLQFESFSILVQSALMRKLGPDLQKFEIWFEKNGPMIAERIADITLKLLQLVERSGPYLQKIWDFFLQLDNATDGWSTKIIALLVLLSALGAAPLVGGILSLAASFLKLGGSIAGLSGAAAILVPLTSAAALMYSSNLNEGEDKEAQRHNDQRGNDDGPGKSTEPWRLLERGQTPEQETRERARSDAWRKLQDVDKDKASFAKDFFKSVGWTSEQASGITANLAAESNFDPKALGDFWSARGIGQWHPDRQKDFKKWAGFDISDARSDLMKQLEFVHYELTEGSEKKAGALLRASKNAEESGSVVSRYYERPGSDEDTKSKEALTRGEMAGQLNQTTNITVHGAQDPAATANAVGGAQQRVNQQLVRNMSTPVN
ncbi:phage tail tip lysozyme [Pseudomonas sp. 10C3]|uniref:phage tail tip lysozyme n=1 Tax=Pseudomonas sp. 10C3 TaxID=3118753 RepID=UPI002E8235EA|nr:phage tail tip lysozyme [Pseudomonas sp. 10C3]MEE3504832.1 phage tail tip lysozyme [Pseudomonas sp. 10C3]